MKGSCTWKKEIRRNYWDFIFIRCCYYSARVVYFQEVFLYNQRFKCVHLTNFININHFIDSENLKVISFRGYFKCLLVWIWIVYWWNAKLTIFHQELCLGENKSLALTTVVNPVWNRHWAGERYNILFHFYFLWNRPTCFSLPGITWRTHLKKTANFIIHVQTEMKQLKQKICMTVNVLIVWTLKHLFLKSKHTKIVHWFIYLSLLSRSFSDHHLRCGGWLNLEFSNRI